MKRKISGLIIVAGLLCATVYGVFNEATMRNHALLFPRDGYYMLDSVSFSDDPRYNPPLGGPAAAFNIHPEFANAQIGCAQPCVNLGGGFGTQYPALVLWFVQVRPLRMSLQSGEPSPDVWNPNSLSGPGLWVRITDEHGNHTEAIARLDASINETGYGQVRCLSLHSFPRSGKRLTAALYGRNPKTDLPVLLGAVRFNNPNGSSKPGEIPQKLPAMATADDVHVQLTQCRYLNPRDLERLPDRFKTVAESLRLPPTKPATQGIAAHFQVVGAKPGQWVLHNFLVSDVYGNRSDALGTDASLCRNMDGYAAVPLSEPLKNCDIQAEFLRNDPAIKVVTINIDPKIALRAQDVVKTVPMPYTGADGKPHVVKTILSITKGSDGNLHAEYGVDHWTPHIYPALELSSDWGWAESAGTNSEGVGGLSIPDAPAGRKTVPIKMTIRYIADVAFKCLPQ